MYGKDTNSYAVYANKPIWGFRFVNNQSEQVSRIGGKINGTVTITDNMLEGNLNTIFIDAGLAQILIERNYFEANAGDYVIKCMAKIQTHMLFMPISQFGDSVLLITNRNKYQE